MAATSPNVKRPFRQWIIKLHLWMGIGAAIFWLLQVVTGVLLTFQFEIDDALVSTDHYPTDYVAIERNIIQMHEDTGTKINWIWTTGGLDDRYLINHTNTNGTNQLARINGNGKILRNSNADDYSFLKFSRQIHLELLFGKVGQIFLGISGILLITNITFGVVVAWPRKGTWLQALKPRNKGSIIPRLYSWHRAVGLWIAIPAIISVTAGTLIQFEHEIEDFIGVESLNFPAILYEDSGAK